MQMSLTGFYYQLPEHKRKKMDESREAAFYNNVVARIDEEPFRALYCEDNGAPNKPIRQMVGGYILMHHKNFSTRELFNQIDFNLLTDVVVAPNNEDDANIHKERVEKIKEKTPEFNENHTDGGYGSKDVDKKMEKHEVRHVVTGIRGRRSEVEIDIEEKGETYCVSCPKQSAEVTKTRKRWKASFDADISIRISAKSVLLASLVRQSSRNRAERFTLHVRIF